MFGGFPFGGMPGMGAEMPGMSRRSGPINNTRYYEALGVDKNASEGDLKKAFRKMAAKHHPDKGGDPDFFKTINEAYDVLKDPKKREFYDQHGEEALKEGGAEAAAGGGMDIFDVLSGRAGGRRGPPKAEDTVHKFSVPIKDFYMGTTKRMQMSRPVKCTQCSGTGSKSRNPTTCERCKGQGRETVVRQMGPMLTQMQQECSRCGGSGRSVKPGDACPNCRGNAIINETKKFEVTLDKGAPEGHKQILRGEAGSSDPSVEPGDIVFVFEEADVRAEAGWQRQGNDLLVTDFPISLKQALCGNEVHLRHLDGHVVKIQREEGSCIKGGDFYRVPDEGMPLHGRPYSKGNLYVRFSIQMPVALEPSALQQLAQILPDDGESETMDADDAEEVKQQPVGSLDKLKEELQYRMRGYRQQKAATDEDDDEMRGGGQRVQCAQQ